MAAFPVNGYETFCPLKIITNILPIPYALCQLQKINYFLFVFSFGGGCDILRAFGAWKMKIGGNYILSRRNIARMIVALATALMLLCSDTTAQAKDFVNRIHDTTDSLVSIDRQMVEATCTVVPEAKYRECKSVYLEAKRYNKEHENPTETARRDASPHRAARSVIAPYRLGRPTGWDCLP